MQENKRKKFIKFAEHRTQNAINEIKKIGNLSNRRAYEFDKADIDKIFRALREALKEAENKFFAKNSENKTFKL